MLKQPILWSVLAGLTASWIGCGSEGTSGVSAAIQDCHDQLAVCDSRMDDCEAEVMGCIDDVDDDATGPEIARDCEDLYVLCTETSGDDFCEVLDRACRDQAIRDDDDEREGEHYEDEDDDDYEDDEDDDDHEDDEDDDDYEDDEDDDDYDD